MLIGQKCLAVGETKSKQEVYDVGINEQHGTKMDLGYFPRHRYHLVHIYHRKLWQQNAEFDFQDTQHATTC